MKNKPLGFQVWIVITSFITIISLIIVMLISYTINDFFINETYEIIINNQNTIIERSKNKELLKVYNSINISPDETKNEGLEARHIIVSKNELKKRTDESKNSTKKILYKTAMYQTQETHRYAFEKESKRLFCVVTKMKIEGRQSYVISYMWDTAQSKLMKSLFSEIKKILIMAWILNITMAKVIANKITAPLRSLENKVRRISGKNWTNPIDLDRNDEIGRLATSINSMQKSLKEKDQKEQLFLQTISHDLKTPIMVIRSYAQALLDGMYLNNSFEDTVNIIGNEAEKLEKKVKQLLYLNSLDFIMQRKKEFSKVDIKEIIDNILNRLSFHKKHIYIHAELQSCIFEGNYEELTIALENILENNTRYAKSSIKIVTRKKQETNNNRIEIVIENDGPHIEKEVLDNLFDRFYKGQNGNFGLGLAISKKIINFHNGNISAQNIENGVEFKIILLI
ncbi:HAMP domain-containing histidine kinase [Lutibacter sp. B2]|nr:HAMP domain-containing histidine kinase [Lutibacter sp. B2]